MYREEESNREASVGAIIVGEVITLLACSREITLLQLAQRSRALISPLLGSTLGSVARNAYCLETLSSSLS